MSNGKPVIVYGASGYTGRLICEYLREFHVPFVAAGRDKARIAEALEKVPGILRRVRGKESPSVGGDD